MPDTEERLSASARSHKEAEARRAESRERLEQIRATARACVALHGGVDKLRQTVGRTDALRILRLAGYDAERLAGNWDEQERPVQHQSSKDLSMYSEDPTYDPTYLDLACRLGPGHPEAVARLAAVRAEQEEARLSGEGRLSVRETMARQMVDQQREAEAHEQRMRDAGWRRGAHGTWVRDRPIFEHDTAGSV